MDQQDSDYVYYRSADYAGFFRRCAALALDVLVLVVFFVGYSAVLDLTGLLGAQTDDLPRWYVPSIVLSAYLYLTLLKRSHIRTPGYWITGLRIVNLKGESPSMLLMSLRLLWWLVGPVNFLIDLLFVFDDENRQTIRDRVVGTYVIHKDASPAGFGEHGMGNMGFMGLMLMYPQVLRPSPASGEPPVEATPGA